MQYEINAVDAFHAACDVPVRAEPNSPTVQDTEVRLRLRLINEEVAETLQALAAGDQVRVADGLGDTMYVTAGTCSQLGARPSVDHAVSAAISILQGAHQVLTKAVQAQNWDEIRVGAECMHISCLGVAAMFGIPYRQVFDLIHTANMDKRGPDGKVIKDAGGKVLKPTQWPEPQPWEPPDERIRALLGR